MTCFFFLHTFNNCYDIVTRCLKSCDGILVRIALSSIEGSCESAQGLSSLSHAKYDVDEDSDRN